MKSTLAGRGFSRLSATDQGTLINEGRQRLDNVFKWPYRLTTASGASPLTITDLGSIEEVVDTNQPALSGLVYADRRSLKDSFGDLTVAGAPRYFYIDNGVVRTYPVGGTLSVRYFKRTPQLVSSGDTPLSPVDYHILIVDMAEQEAHANKTDWQGGEALQLRIQRKLTAMVNDLFGQQIVGSDSAPVSYASSDW